MPIQKIPVQISESAIHEINHILTKKNIPEGYGLRLGVRGGGCSKPALFIGFDTPKPTDDCYACDGFELLIEKRHLMHLLGVNVDFLDTDEEQGFLLTHPEK